MLVEKKDVAEFVMEIKKALDKTGTILVAEALETMDSLVKDDSRRKQNWYVKEKFSPNTLATIFGEVHYRRTYYEHKKTKDYRYLSDELVGISAYDKMDVSLKAKLIEEGVCQEFCAFTIRADLLDQMRLNFLREING
jgi:hypothetical protein